MATQIVCDGEVIYEFESEIELHWLNMIILHAKFETGTRNDITFNPFPNRLVRALSSRLKYLSSKDQQFRLFEKVAIEPTDLGDRGQLQQRLVELLKYEEAEENSAEWIELLEMGMYPWAVNEAFLGNEEESNE